jgi:hypothetical protein
LVLLAAPAAVAIWSGWVALGQMCGFGLVHPLPGIADRFTLNTAITLPIGVEAYSAYALGTWLSGAGMPARARRFAMWSSLAGLAVGLVGQVIYHLLVARHYTTAPDEVVVFVACLPVLALGAGAALHHLINDRAADTDAVVNTAVTNAAALTSTEDGSDASAIAVLDEPGWDGTWLPAGSDRDHGAPGSGKTSKPDRERGPDDPSTVAAGVEPLPRVDVSDLLEPGRRVADELKKDGKSLTRRALGDGLRKLGMTCGNARAAELARQLNAEYGDHIGVLEAVS